MLLEKPNNTIAKPHNTIKKPQNLIATVILKSDDKIMKCQKLLQNNVWTI